MTCRSLVRGALKNCGSRDKFIIPVVEATELDVSWPLKMTAAAAGATPILPRPDNHAFGNKKARREGTLTGPSRSLGGMENTDAPQPLYTYDRQSIVLSTQLIQAG